MKNKYLLLFLFISISSSYAEKPLNIVLILADDLGWSNLGCYGSNFIETPNIDKLAAEGIRFTDAYSASTVCSPTRASIMTGQNPARIGMYNILRPHRRPWAKLRPPPLVENLPLDIVTLAEHLEKHAGYVSAAIGKWHLGYDKNHQPKSQGFSATHEDPFSLSSTYTYTNDLLKFKKNNTGKQVGKFTAQAIRFIEKHKDQPFFLYLAHSAVHYPAQARKDLIDKYQLKYDRLKPKMAPEYAAMTEALDESVGWITRALEELGLEENTVVIFFSDNGAILRTFISKEMAANNEPFRGQKGALYEGGIRVPLIIKWPKVVAPGSVCQQPVISNDFFPTILQIAKIDKKPDQALDGKSIVPLLKDEGPFQRNELYWHFPAYQLLTPSYAIREGDFKLIEFFEDGELELYNLINDPGEKENLAETMPEKVETLRKKWRSWQQALNAGLPRANPDYDINKSHLWGERGYGKL